MSLESSELINLYSETVFCFTGEASEIPNPCAIITAYNPKSKLFSDKHNKTANDALEQDISEVYYLPVDGASIDKTHQEPSFMVQISKPAAVGLAEKYSQNAIYWLEGDDLHIVPVLMEGDEISIGSFQRRVQSNDY